jgi:hypothetical protein
MLKFLDSRWRISMIVDDLDYGIYLIPKNLLLHDIDSSEMLDYETDEKHRYILAKGYESKNAILLKPDIDYSQYRIKNVGLTDSREFTYTTCIADSEDFYSPDCYVIFVLDH